MGYENIIFAYILAHMFRKMRTNSDVDIAI